MRGRAALAAAVCALFATGASADRLVRGVTDVTTIEDLQGRAQVLFRWDPAIAEGNVAVWQALLRFEAEGDDEARALTLRVYPITSEWDAQSRHIAFDAELWSRAEVDLRRSGPVVVDLTVLVKEIVEHGMTAYGFVVLPDDGEGLTPSDLASLGGLSSGTVEVSWRKVPAPPTRGVRERG
jgi:hypothetical protein